MQRPYLLSFYVLTSIILSSIGCSSNTIWSDSSYRMVGNGNSMANQRTIPLDSITKNSSPEFNHSTGSITSPLSSNDNPKHLVRYGDPKLIQKIIKTAKIHCNPIIKKIRTNSDGYWNINSSVFKQCSYRFPKNCGGHLFAILEFENKQALTYLHENDPQYVIDLIQGTPHARAGLWDMEDRIGTQNTNLGYIFEGKIELASSTPEMAPLLLGWAIQASIRDEEDYGSQYHNAIQEIKECF